jgi:short-subunit dehydrogenase
LELTAKTILLTGASSGLGPHIARRLHAAGAKLLLSARNRAALEALAAETGGSQVLPADLARRGEAERLAGEVGAVDILVSNAGVPASGALDDLSVEEIDRALEVNLRAGIVLTRLLLPAMLRRGSGQIVLMASMAGHVPGPKTSVYNATKFGLRGFGLALRQELRGTGVGVSLISPTYVSEAGMWAETGMKASAIAGEVSPAEVADAVLKAILRNRREIQVASPIAVVGSRLLNLLPGLTEVGPSPTTHPDQAVEKQRRKR